MVTAWWRQARIVGRAMRCSPPYVLLVAASRFFQACPEGLTLTWSETPE